MVSNTLSNEAVNDLVNPQIGSGVYEMPMLFKLWIFEPLVESTSPRSLRLHLDVSLGKQVQTLSI
jgi:hypothetical protein